MALPDVACELEGDEHEAAFEAAASSYPGSRVYRRRSPIHIPVIRLERRSEEAP